VKSSREKAVQIARKILEIAPVILDTETSGLDSRAEIVEIAVVDTDGRVLVNTLVKPSRPIPPDVSAIHGSPIGLSHVPLHSIKLWCELLKPILTLASWQFTMRTLIYE